jgi:hypothetical protein
MALSPGYDGRKQIIRGQEYTQYSPQWYDAMDQNKIHNAQTTGTAAGSGAKSALDALGGLVGGGDASASASAGAGATAVPARIGGGAPMPSFESFDGGGGSAAAAPHAQLDQAKMDAMEAATFGRAKDKVGQTTTGALAGLRSALAGRGMLGGGGEYRGTAAVAQRGQGELGDTVREQAIHSADMNLDLEKTNLGADVAQRGQDLSTSTARRGQNMDYASGYRGQDIQQRGQDIQAQEAAATLAQTKSLAEAARRQSILEGLMSATNKPGLY